jgi:Na+-transporting NADH:ubiquinone oxidoreductase subunit NqrC
MSLLNIESLAKEWIKLFKKQPVMTLVSTFVSAITLSAVIFTLDHVDTKKREAERLKNLNYQTQIQQLDVTENNIRQLLTFIENQKSTLRETEDTISSLQKEREKLKPIVESDRSVVEAIFRAQEERSHASIWRERLIGFAFGIAASLIATFIWFVISILWKHKNNRTYDTAA